MTEAQRKRIKKLFWMGPDRRTVTVEDIAFAGLKEERAEARRAGREEGRAEGREKGRDEGRRIGRKEGREEGREEGYEAALRDLLRAQIVVRFGRLPRGAASRLKRATPAELRRIGARLVAAKAPSDVFG
ncbi:MAG: hypothetical protein JNJ54_18180 [Myxococcaceae bacterium]|nr:hypothetical protein [Myxococcaceae bacterium]